MGKHNIYLVAYSLLGALEQASKAFYLDQPTSFHHIEYCQLWVSRGRDTFDKRTFTLPDCPVSTVMPDGSAPSLSQSQRSSYSKRNVIIEPPNYYLYGEQGTFCNKVNPAQ